MTNPNKVGLVVGALIGGRHVCWSLQQVIRYADSPLLILPRGSQPME
jgi:hypothetical protein